LAYLSTARHQAIDVWMFQAEIVLLRKFWTRRSSVDSESTQVYARAFKEFRDALSATIA